jgi:hypothetical protein
MAYFPNNIIAAVDRAARIYYINRAQTKLWNDNRRSGELRLLTGWTWVARNGSNYRQGFKTASVAYRDAYYVLVKHSRAPVDVATAGRRKVA